MKAETASRYFDDGLTRDVDRRGREPLAAVAPPSSDFLATLSHELRNSLGAIRNASYVLRTEVSASTIQNNARLTIERQVQQMTRLVDDLLDISRIKTGKLHLECERIDLCPVVARALQSVQFLMQQRSHRVTVSLPESPVWVHGDAMRLEQVFVNLLTNAAKYTDAGGEVRVTVSGKAGEAGPSRELGAAGEVSASGEAVVRILDTGIGIAPDVLPHVFDLYLQVRTSSRNPGLGLGLPLVRSLVERHGGSVTVTSPGLCRGSEFTVRLPTLAPV